MSFVFSVSLLLFVSDPHLLLARRIRFMARNQNLFNDIFHTAGKYFSFCVFIKLDFIGFEDIENGKIASTIPEMVSVQSISFDFKVKPSHHTAYYIFNHFCSVCLSIGPSQVCLNH